MFILLFGYNDECDEWLKDESENLEQLKRSLFDEMISTRYEKPGHLYIREEPDDDDDDDWTAHEGVYDIYYINLHEGDNRLSELPERLRDEAAALGFDVKD